MQNIRFMNFSHQLLLHMLSCRLRKTLLCAIFLCFKLTPNPYRHHFRLHKLTSLKSDSKSGMEDVSPDAKDRKTR